MLLSQLILGALLQQQSSAYHIDSLRIAPLKDGEARAAGIVFTPDPNIFLIVARDLELRWVGFRKPGDQQVIRRKKITVQPIPVFSPDQLKEIEKAKKMLADMGLPAKDYPLVSEVIRLPGDKEFCLTDRHDEFFFYSTETGDLISKKTVLKKGWPSRTDTCEVSADKKYANIGDGDRHVQMIYDLDSGKLLFEVKSAFLESVRLSADSKSVFHLSLSGLLTSYALPTGKKEWSFQLPQKVAGHLVVNPKGGQVAYNSMPGYNYDGSFTLDLATKKITEMSRDIKQFGLIGYTPDGSMLLYYQPKWIHFADVKTGKHLMTLNPYFTAMWDTAMTIGVSADCSRLILVNDPANEYPDLRYSIMADLKQKPGDPVKLPIVIK